MTRSCWKPKIYVCEYTGLFLIFSPVCSVVMGVHSHQRTDKTCGSWRANCRSSAAEEDTWKLQRGTAALKWALLSGLSRWVFSMADQRINIWNGLLKGKKLFLLVSLYLSLQSHFFFFFFLAFCVGSFNWFQCIVWSSCTIYHSSLSVFFFFFYLITFNFLLCSFLPS